MKLICSTVAQNERPRIACARLFLATQLSVMLLNNSRMHTADFLSFFFECQATSSMKRSKGATTELINGLEELVYYNS